MLKGEPLARETALRSINWKLTSKTKRVFSSWSLHQQALSISLHVGPLAVWHWGSEAQVTW